MEIPANCKGCGACCEEMTKVMIGEKEDWVSQEMTLPTKPAIIDHGEIAAREMKMVPAGPDKTRCVALDPLTKLCTIYDKRPLVCQEFARGCHSCRIVLYMAAGSDRMMAERFAWKLPPEFKREPGIDTRREYRSGFVRVHTVRGWSDWICQRCYRHSKRYVHIKHTDQCSRGRVPTRLQIANVDMAMVTSGIADSD